MSSQNAPTFAEVEQAANALGLHLDTKKQRLKLDKGKQKVVKNTAIYVALAPLFRQVVQQYITPGLREKDPKGIVALEADFAELFANQLAPRRGAPSLFKRCCDAMKIDEDDSSWILHIVVASLLQGVIGKYADHLSQQESSESSRLDDDFEVEEPVTQLGKQLKHAGLVHEGIPLDVEVDISPKAVAQLVSDAQWQSHQMATADIWQNFSLALLLRRGDDATSSWIEHALRQSSGPRKAQRLKALATIRQGQAVLNDALIAQQEEAGPHEDSEVQYERRSVEFSAVLLDLTLGVFKRSGKPPITLTENDGHDVRRLLPSENLMRALTKIEYAVRLTDTAGPMLNKPKPWTMKGQHAGGLAHGGLHHRKLGFYKFQAKNKPIRDFLKHMGDDSAAYANVFEAVNALQETSWRVNPRVWEVMQALIKASEDPDVLDTGLGQSFEHIALPNSITSKWKPWLESRFFARSGPVGNAGKKKKPGAKNLASPGWRLVSPVGAPEILRLAEKENFYFAYNVDSRGRIYPIGSYLHPQGEDTFRALLEFGTGKPITEQGVAWLALHGSECASRTQILSDLEIADRSSPTIEERIKWIVMMSHEICECAEEPLENTWWREVGGRSAFQFLAFCFAWNDYKTKGHYVNCHLPVHVDGTCNGLQHIAALTGDEELAKAVNLLPSELPNDIYLRMAESVQSQATDDQRSIAPLIKKCKKPFQATLIANEVKLRKLLSHHPNLIDRETAKKVVMVIPYGAGVRTYANELASHIRNYNGGKQFDETLSECGQAVVAAMATEKKSTAKQAQHMPDKLLQVLPKVIQDESWKPLYYGRLLLATLLAWEFQATLDAQYPVVKRFKDWLHVLTKAMIDRGLPMTWVSPTGFAVLQNGFRRNVEQIDIKGLTRIRLSHYVLIDQISERKQMLGILPNFIHSLDSSHLVTTIQKSRQKRLRSFSMIHDSYGTHASEMPLLAQALREAFCELYSVDRLDELRTFVTALLNNDPLQIVDNKSRAVTKARLISLVNANFSMPTIDRIECIPEFERMPNGFSVEQVKDSEYFFY